MLKKLTVILVMTIALLLMIAGCQPSSELTTGMSPAPDFALQDLEGQTVTLSDLRGSPVMLNFWATWCGPCRHEMPFIQQIYEEWLDKGLVLLTINLRETPAKVEEFMQSNGLSFPALLDRDGSVSLEYNVSGIPTTFFIDKDGIIQEKRIGSFSSAAEIEDYLDEIMP